MTASRAGRWAAVAVPTAFLAVFFAWPVVAILGRGLLPDGRPDAGAFVDVLTDASLRRVAWFTLWQALASTAVTVALGLPGAYVLSRYRFRGRALVRALVTVPFVLPTVVVGAAFLALFDDDGPIGRVLDVRDSVWAIVAAHAFFNYAVVVRTVGGLWAHLDPRQGEVAQVLGASRRRAFLEVTVPALRPAITAAAAIVFLFSFTSFGVVLILGGLGRSTLEVEIYRLTAQLLDLRTAAALAALQLAAVAATVLVSGRAQARRAVAQRLLPQAQVAAPVDTPARRALLAANLAVMAVLLGAPVLTLVERSVRVGDGWGLAHYRTLGDAAAGGAVLVAPVDALRNSLWAAAVATVLAVTVGVLAAAAVAGSRPARWLETLVMLPLGTSAVTVGFGFLIALDEPPLDLRTSVWLIPIAQAVVALPFVVRAVVPVLRSIDPRLREAAAVLGAAPLRIRREVDVPLTARAAAVGAGFAAAVSLGEFGATVFVARPERMTLPVAIFRLLGRPGEANLGRAMALSVVLMAVTALVVLVVERARLGDLGEF